MRVLITGSRNYAERYNNLVGTNRQLTPQEANRAKDLDVIDLRKAWKYFNQALKFAETAGHKSITYVHGFCPRGFDKICSEWIANMRKTQDLKIEIVEEKHPADWVEHGTKAGPIRNTVMADSGGDFCIAGWNGDTSGSGTNDMIVKVVKRGIDVKICTPVVEEEIKL